MWGEEGHGKDIQEKKGRGLVKREGKALGMKECMMEGWGSKWRGMWR